MSGGPIQLVLCFDERVLVPAEVSIASALWTARRMKVGVNVMTTALSETAERELTRLCEILGAVSFRVRRVTLDRFAGITSTNRHIPLETYLNLLMGSVFPDLDRVIYLDADVLVRSDLAGLWTMDFGDNVCIGSDKAWGHVPEYRASTGLSAEDVYINNGVMLVDLKAWRDDGCEERLVAKAQACGSRLPCMDQDVLNIVLRGRIGTMPSPWNFTSYEYAANRRDWRIAKVLHFSAVPKPWQGAADGRAREWRVAELRVRELLRTGGRPAFHFRMKSVMLRSYLLVRCLFSGGR